MNGHIFLLQSQRLRDGIPRALGPLRRRPHFSFAVAVYRQRGRRLHRGMRQQRRVIFRLDDLSAICKCRLYVAVLTDHFACFPRRILQLFLVRLRVPNAVRALLPLDVQLFPSLDRRPSVISQHRHATEGLKADGRLKCIDCRCLLHACEA